MVLVIVHDDESLTVEIDSTRTPVSIAASAYPARRPARAND